MLTACPIEAQETPVESILNISIVSVSGLKVHEEFKSEGSEMPFRTTQWSEKE